MDGASTAVAADAALVPFDACACSERLGAVRGLSAGRSGDAVNLFWDTIGSGFEVWRVERKEDIDGARRGGAPAAVPVPGCSFPDPAKGSYCSAPGAVRLAPALLFYQVRSLCTPTSDGP